MSIVSNTPEPDAAALRPRIGTSARGGDIEPVGTSPKWGGDPMSNDITAGPKVTPPLAGQSGDPHISAIPK